MLQPKAAEPVGTITCSPMKVAPLSFDRLKRISLVPVAALPGVVWKKRVQHT